MCFSPLHVKGNYTSSTQAEDRDIPPEIPRTTRDIDVHRTQEVQAAFSSEVLLALSSMNENTFTVRVSQLADSVRPQRRPANEGPASHEFDTSRCPVALRLQLTCNSDIRSVNPDSQPEAESQSRKGQAIVRVLTVIIKPELTLNSTTIMAMTTTATARVAILGRF